jgi:hypothetical protein
VTNRQISWSEQSINPIDRCCDGKVLNTILPDGCVVQSYQEVLDGTWRAVHIVNRADHSAVLIDCQDKVRIISSNARMQLNEAGGRAAIGKDRDYLAELSAPGDVGPCIYYATISAEKEGTQVFVHDHDMSNKYVLSADLELERIVLIEKDEPEPSEAGSKRSLQEDSFISAPGKNKGKGGKKEEVVEKPPEEPLPETEDIGGYVEPLTKSFLYPRLFVFHPDGTGFEWMTKDQLSYYKRVQKAKQEALSQRTMTVIGSTATKFFMFLTKWRSLKEKELMSSNLLHLDFPQNAVFAIKRLREFGEDEKQAELGHQKALPDQFMLRQILEYPDYEPLKQEAFFDDWRRYRDWKLTQARYDTEFGITHVAPKGQELDMMLIADDEFFAARTLKKIIEKRI